MSFFVSHNTAKQRYEICKTCEHLNTLIKVCSQCRCFMPAKTTLSMVHCPIMKWDKAPADSGIVESYHVPTDIQRVDPIMSMISPKVRMDQSPLQHGDIWIDISKDMPTLHNYDIETDMWNEMPQS